MPNKSLKIKIIMRLKYFGFLFLGFLLFASSIRAFSSSLPSLGGELVEQEIGQVSQELQTRRQEIEKLKKAVEEYRQKIVSQRNQAFSLQNQINILDTQIAKTKIEIKAKEQEIELIKLDIIETQKEIEQLEQKIKNKKEKLSEFLRVIYQNDEKSYLEILLMNDSLSDFFNEAKYIENLHDGLHQSVLELKKVVAALDSKLLSLNSKQKILEKEKFKLEEQQARLESQEQVKSNLLTQTRSNEQKFRNLLTNLKAEQESINSEIIVLEKQLRAKLAEQKKQNALEAIGKEQMIWPVAKNVITAYFHDPSYPYRYIFEHPGIDIRANQRSVVKASASGYVAKIRLDPNCSSLYSYIMIIHANGLSTVYGHMNEISVSEGDFVVQGQKIGYSGGMPGTCGSGRLTTGPHVHFEVRLNGIPVDPLGYLK